jgi:hypothetical protein
MSLCFTIGSCAFSQTSARSVVDPASRQPVRLGALSAEASAGFTELSARASIVFAGQVLSVEHQAGVVEIRFRVDVPVRGCAQAGIYTLLEWAGLWASEPMRYRVGQRLLMLLPPPGKGGLSAPLGGMDGAIPLLATALPPLGPAHTASLQLEQASALEDTLTPDLRWLEARAVRTVNPAQTASSRQDTPWLGPVVPFSRDASVNANADAPAAHAPTLHALLAGSGLLASAEASQGARNGSR